MPWSSSFLCSAIQALDREVELCPIIAWLRQKGLLNNACSICIYHQEFMTLHSQFLVSYLSYQIRDLQHRSPKVHHCIHWKHFNNITNAQNTLSLMTSGRDKSMININIKNYCVKNYLPRSNEWRNRIMFCRTIIITVTLIWITHTNDVQFGLPDPHLVLQRLQSQVCNVSS